MRTRLLLASLCALAAACSTPSSRIARMYAQVREEAAQPRAGGPDRALLDRRADRARKTREIAESGALSDAGDLLKASVILVEADDAVDLKLAEEIALRAAEKGEALGFRVAAEAADKQLVKRGQPQRYGTQYEWVPVLKKWRLYALDPLTTDVERAAMGVPSLADLRRAEDELNRAAEASPR